MLWEDALFQVIDRPLRIGNEQVSSFRCNMDAALSLQLQNESPELIGKALGCAFLIIRLLLLDRHDQAVKDALTIDLLLRYRSV